MSTDRNEKQDLKKRRREAREKLLLFLRRLRSGCARLESLAEWYDRTQQLESLLEEHAGDFVNEQVLVPVREAMKATDASREGLKRACQVLSIEVEKLIKKGLPVGGGSAIGTALIGALILVAVTIMGAIVYVEYTAVEVKVTNRGCDECPLCSQLLPDWLPGVGVPEKPIRSGETGAVTLPRMAFQVDWTARDSGVLFLPGGLDLPIPRVPARVVSIKLNGGEMLGRVTSVNLGDRPPHEVVFECR